MRGERVGKSKKVFETVKDARVSINILAREREEKANNNNRFRFRSYAFLDFFIVKCELFS